MDRANNKNILIVDNTLSGKIVDDTDRVDGAVIYWDEAEDKYKHAEVDPATGVPYSGAILDVDLGGHKLTTESVVFNDSPTVTPVDRELFWDVDNDTLTFSIPDGGMIQINQEPFDYYLNNEGAQIVNGDIVSVVGAASTKTAVVLCDATDDDLAKAVIGMVTVATINNNQVGRITKNGGKVRGLNTNAYTEGDTLWVDPLNPGKWTATMPTAPTRSVKIGTVTVKSVTDGVVELQMHVESKLTELADVDGTPLTTLGQIPVWHQTEGVFDFDYNITDYMYSAYAEIHCHDAAVAQSIPTGATYTKVTAFTDNGLSANCTADAANDKITITKAGKYRVEGTFSFTCGTNGVIIKGSAFLGGTEQNNVHFEDKVGTGSDVRNAGFTGIVNASSVPVDLDFRIRHDNGGSVNYTFAYANINCSMVGL